MKNSQRGFISMDDFLSFKTAVIIIVVLIIAGGSYIYNQNKKITEQDTQMNDNLSVNKNLNPNQNASSSPTDASNWVTYNSDQYLSLSFIYPKSLGTPVKSNYNNTQGPVGPVITIGHSPNPIFTIFHGAYVSNGRNQSLEDVAKPLPYQKVKNTIIDGRKAVILSGASTGLAEYTAYIVGNGGNIIMVDFVYNYSSYPDGESVFNKILDSVKIVQV